MSGMRLGVGVDLDSQYRSLRFAFVLTDAGGSRNATPWPLNGGPRQPA
jgi:hypothetical protein